MKALFAQANNPYLAGGLSPRLVEALRYILCYLDLRPPSVWSETSDARRHIRSWSDASGMDRIIAVIVKADSAWYWTRLQVPLSWMESLIPRGDNHIGALELIAPVLALGTWPQLFVDSLWSAFIDNEGALGALLKGTCLAADMNEIVGRLWLNLDLQQCDLFVQRVESKANVADGPTRHFLGDVEKLGAVYSSPVLPSWLDQIWHDSVFCS